MQKLIKISPLLFMFLILLNDVYFKKWGFDLHYAFLLLFLASSIYIVRNKVENSNPKSRNATILLFCALGITALVYIIQVKEII